MSKGEPADAAPFARAPDPSVVPQSSTVTSDAGYRTAVRDVRAALGAGARIQDASASLEQLARPAEPARTARVRSLEGTDFAIRAVRGVPAAAFAAFLDGVQQSRVVDYADGAPIVHATVAAVIRERRERRLHTWKHLVESRVYAPRRHMPAEVWERLAHLGPVDSSIPDEDQRPTTRHPLGALERAVDLAQRHREALEQRLAASWCERESRPLLVDGGISGSERVARTHCAIGVVKSHRTLYAVDERIDVVLRLGRGERTTAFLIEPSRRTPVASWYLRLRDPAGRDPMFALVRVEVARDPAQDLGARADEVSRWLLAESAPLALPDARWDRMVYGVRDSEEFLRAIT